MPGLGARVGGAYVDTNLKFDERSISEVGQRVHRQLSKLSNRLADIGERNGEIYRTIGRDAVVAWRSLLGTIVSSAPLIGSAISGVAGAATMLAGSLYSAVQSSLGFLPLLSAMGVAAATAILGFQGFATAIKVGDFTGLSRGAESAARAVASLEDSWTSLRDTISDRMFAGLADDIRLLGDTLFPVLEKRLGKMAGVLNELGRSLLRYVNSAPGLKQIGNLLENSTDIFKRLSKAAVPFLDGLLKSLNALAPAGKRLADRITDLAHRFQDWASAPGFMDRVDDSMSRAEKTAGLLFKVLGNLSKAIANIFTAANPVTNQFLQMLVDVTQRFEDWTKSIEGKNSIKKWAENSMDVMEQLGKTLGAVFDVIAELADSRVIISFLKTLQGAFENIGKLPLDKMVNFFVQIAEALQPLSSFLLSIVIAGAAFNFMIGNIAGQIGGLFSVARKVLKPLQLMFKPLESAGAHGKELRGIAAALGRIVEFATRFSKFIPFVGWAIWIGILISKSKDLQHKFGDLWDAIKDVGSKISEAFGKIEDSLGPLAPVVSALIGPFDKVFDILDQLGTMLIGFTLDDLIDGFTRLGTAIEGIGDLVSGAIDVLTGFFTGNLPKMKDGLSTFLDGLSTLLSSFKFADIQKSFLDAGRSFISSLGQGMSEGASGLTTFIQDLPERILSFFVSLPGRLLSLGQQAISFLGTAFSTGVSTLAGIAENIVVGIATTLAQLPSRLLSLGQQAILFLWNSFVQGVNTMIVVATHIVTGVINVIAQMPGRLSALGKSAISLLVSAISEGVPRAASSAGRILSSVVSALSSMPGKLAELARRAVGRLVSEISDGVGRARSAANRVASAILNAVQDLPGQMLRIGRSIVQGIIDGITSMIGQLGRAAGAIARTVKDALPGSPVKEGPLTEWNYGSGATGGGRKVVDAIAGGLQETKAIRDAMSNIASLMTLPNVSLNASRSTTGSKSSGDVTTFGDVHVTIPLEDLKQIQSLEEFLEMLKQYRNNSRKTLRSGVVTA